MADPYEQELANLSGRQLLARAMQMYGQQPDVTSLNEYAAQRQRQGQMDMVNALAAQYAGKGFQPVQETYLKRSLAAQTPQEIGDYGIVSGGKFTVSPFAGRKEQASALLNMGGKVLDNEEADARERRLAAQYSAMLARQNKPDPFGTGAATQIGTDDKGTPLFRDTSTGQLFNYVGGKPTLYGGPINPKTSNAQPSEDERKAAGWFAQSDLAIRNMDEALKLDPNASKQPLSEVFTQAIPMFGEAITQSQRTGPRQMFTQASESMAEALLRAATGAGINESEARQKVKELVPVYGNKDVTIAQKKRGYKTYMAGLRARAGRAMPALEAALKDAYAGMSEGGDDGVVDLPSPGSR